MNLFQLPHVQTSVLVTVNLVDVNDNVPEFGSSEYIGMVEENTPPGTTVELV